MTGMDTLNFVELAVMPSLLGLLLSFHFIVTRKSRIAMRLILLLLLQIPLVPVVILKPDYAVSINRVEPFSYEQIGSAVLFVCHFSQSPMSS